MRMSYVPKTPFSEIAHPLARGRSSIKSLFTILGGNGVEQVNGSYFDSVDITNSLGSYQFYVAGVPYPARPLSALRNKAGIFQELTDCWSGNTSDMYGRCVRLF